MRHLGAAFATGVVIATSPVVVNAAPRPDCSMMTATPSGSALVVWCATSEQSTTTGRVERVRLWRTTGNGRWVEARAANVAVSDVPAPPQVSPRWAQDRTLYWATSTGLYASDDLGDTFRLVSPLLTGSDHPVRRVLLTDDGGSVRATVAGSDPHDVGWTSWGGVTVPFAGSPEEDLLPVRAGDAVGMLAWDAVTTAPHKIVGYRCAGTSVCATTWFSLLAPSDGWAQQLAGSWYGPGQGASASTFVGVRAGRDFARLTLWRVGTEAAALPAANALLAAVADGRNAPMAELAFSGGRTVLRILSWADRHRTAHDRLYVSSDRGESWHLVVAAATDRRGRVSGPTSWRPGAVSLSFVPALHVRDDVWLANVSDGTRYTLRCSRDGGRRWRPSCL